MRARTVAWLAAIVLALASCGGESEPPSAPAEEPQAAAAGLPAAPPAAADLPNGLLVAVSYFERKDGKPLPKSELVMLVRRDGRWQARAHEDPASNVFHKAMVYAPPGRPPGILTLGGSAAAVKLWRAGEGGLRSETLWEKDFGGKFSRMRDAEVGDVLGDGTPVIAVATHDQGVVALIRPGPAGWEVTEIDEEPDKFVHEIEIGDLDADGVLEVYATPSDPNRLTGEEQHGEVVRYVPAKGEGREVVADLGGRHAKEILVEDVDGDGTDELYVSVEAAEGGSLAIRRYDAGTTPGGGALIASFEDPMARFLTAGDVDGDGVKEMVVAAKDTGLWLLRPDRDPRGPWLVKRIDADSKGFEHASLLTDLDGDGTDELYVASDDDREIRRYVWIDGGFARETIYKRPGSLPLLTWNLMPSPMELLP